MRTPFEISFPKIGEPALGYISVAEKTNLPFVPRRVYWTYFTPENVERGGHAHIGLEQILVAVSGKIELSIEITDGRIYKFCLDSPDKGIYIPRMSWRSMKYTHNAVQMCIASIEYDEKDYIRSYSEYIAISGRTNGS
jgi:hypothetical protein